MESKLLPDTHKTGDLLKLQKETEYLLDYIGCGVDNKRIITHILRQDKYIRKLETRADNSAVLLAAKEAIEILIEEKVANMGNKDSIGAIASTMERTKSSGKEVHELIAERYAKIEAALAAIKE